MSLYSLCALKTLISLPQGKMDLQFRKDVQSYDQVTVCHQGPKLIILHCKNLQQQRYVLCLADAFSADDFGLLQRLLRLRAANVSERK
jgi:hypothetical protein